MPNPWFIRQYRIIVSNGNNVALDISDLRCTFKIEKSFKAINFGEVTIYNLSANTQADIIQYGMRVVIEAGYENGNYGVIFDGDVYQPIWNREDIVDNTLTLCCFDGNSVLINNMISATVEASHDMRT